MDGGRGSGWNISQVGNSLNSIPRKPKSMECLESKRVLDAF